MALRWLSSILASVILVLVPLAATSPSNQYDFAEGINSQTSTPLRIAIVGAGIGGSAAAWYVQQEMARAHQTVEIDVFEASNRTCGRMMAMELGGQRYEVGAAVAHPRNQYIEKLLEEAGLSKLAAATGEFGLVLKPGEFVSLGNAKESWSEDFHLLERYGHSVVILDLLLDYLFNEFVDLYHLQSESPPRTFTNLSDMLESLPVNFTELCQISFTDYLKQKDIPDDLVDELVSATVQAVYNQDGRLITALSGMVSLARSANDKYWSVLGGNEILCPHLLSKTNATLHLNSPVTEIMYVSSAGLAVTYQETLTSLQESMYNAVILATPLPSSGIQLKGFPQPVPALNPGIYQKTTTTLVKGDVNLTYFGLDVDADVPWLFGMPASNDIPISLIELTPPVDGSATQGKPVWKVQSTDSLLKTPANLQFLNMLFPNCTATEHTFVNAYPHFTSPDSLGPLVLGEGLFYSSGIEWAGSAMEMSCISAKNSALSLVRFLHSVFSS